MRRRTLWAFIVWGSVSVAPLEATLCGGGETCAKEEHCCAHTIATFCENQTCAYAYEEGECLPDTVPCGHFWCGPQRCATHWYTQERVCCVYDSEGQSAYACKPSTLSCRGNADRVTIRSDRASRSEPGG